jgi:hypothetical protein
MSVNGSGAREVLDALGWEPDPDPDPESQPAPEP